MLTIRMSKNGRKKAPLFTIVATDSRKAREGLYIEKLGFYNPALEAGKNLTQVKTDKIKAWMEKGAQVSDTVKNLLKANNVQI
ncbi:MAG: 30S ribosomal protein S16 [Bdellovibrio sp. CG12_big_fil_rev_8_21_14_0_65_39_13]|nr:MAG: 30S ribosomal protein S16 [Bdellovibrio sp. CG22_combo_CG10-13_8_21_14_all_39_27]PIQ61307.1 MAG: 30S ribosomal protein S16 [Bdellovibrio sp. CG12_big_fil_rev_8_21_14_0_65_39_13]PIR33616.1 MAG: 30S ribosomal protein S16 [Bdellovibrio sp. CG11_big_fil_rev_8_21_14_0_20_39_38]PJB52577.1 MAG: 30S ribosomal protein S16 [Bdellovibrio sp. CG_4_9_14_3_um_filter_39_7]